MKLAKSYQPALYEADIYALWEKLAAFKPKGQGAGYAIVVPPPNANGSLHIGHALSFALQDIAARYHRAKGDKVLFLPGADHAGFETQVVYERELEKQGKSRFDYSRESLYSQIYDFVAANRETFETQIRRLGASVDWSRYTFTLDEPIVKQAYATFKKMWDDGLIYRGERLVNFCTTHGTAFADIEVDHLEEHGFLWQINYPLTDGTGNITVATTRPETLLGDTAVAVNPNDTRYKHLVGKTVRLPLTNRDIPIVADDYVQPDFGTGAVKITPAHDPNDYALGKRHDLPLITVIGFDGRTNHNVAPQFQNLTVLEAREAVVAELKRQDILLKAEPYTHSVGHCYKCSTIIEPLLKEQWFVDIKPLAQPAIKALRENKLAFLPKAKRDQLENYLESVWDWNISRQIAWGIPIPAFQNENDPGDWIYNEAVDQEVITIDNKLYRRDPDVFDTWFSSSAWPYATLGFPDSEDFKTFYPLALMETGFDILMQWVSRMLMLGLYVTNEVPFKAVYLHGLVTDEHGQKMSKSKGNVINPMKVVDEYGSDALRIGMISGQTAGNNQPYHAAKIIGGRNFCNKLWNIARFIESLVESFDGREGAVPETEADHWIIERYDLTRQATISLMDDYRFSEAFEKIYHFVWDDLADWYIEVSKTKPNHKLLAAILEATLTLVHPFAPFLSETIWQTLELSPNSLLSNQPIKILATSDELMAANFEELRKLILSIRSIQKAVAASKVTLYYQEEAIVANNATLISQLAHLKSVESTDQGQGIAVPETNLNCWLDIDQKLIDSYKVSLQEKINKAQADIRKLHARLANSNYTNKAPEKLIAESREQMIETEHTLENYLLEKQRYT